MNLFIDVIQIVLESSIYKASILLQMTYLQIKDRSIVDHINEINSILETSFNQQDEELTLSKLFELDIQKKAYDLIEISTKALQERNLRQTLGQVEKILAETDMMIKPYKEGGYVLGGVD